MTMNREFWRAMRERALVTAAQAWLLYVGAAGPFDAFKFDWLESAGFAVGGAVLAVIKGLAAHKITGDGPSLSSAETLS